MYTGSGNGLVQFRYHTISSTSANLLQCMHYDHSKWSLTKWAPTKNTHRNDSNFEIESKPYCEHGEE